MTGSNTLVVYLLDPQEVERPILERRAAGARSSGDELDKLRMAIETELAQRGSGPPWPAILTTGAVASYLRRELRAQLPLVPVLSYQDLAPDANIQPLARIGSA